MDAEHTLLAAPQVTVVIPVWDSYAKFVSDAAESVLGQPTPARVVIVDNASETEIPAIDGCELVRSEHRVSRGAIRNLGLAAVETEYVVFLDADDVLLPGALARLLGALERRPASPASAARILEPSGAFHRTPRHVSAVIARRPRVFAWTNAVWSQFSTQGCTVMRTDAVRRAGGYADSSDAEDWALGVSLAFRGRLGFDPEPALLYRRRPGCRDRSTDQLLANAALIRNTLLTDEAVGARRWQLAMLAVTQVLAVLFVRPVVRGRRWLTLRRGRAPHTYTHADCGLSGCERDSGA